MTDAIKKTAMGIKRMSVILWCVTAICFIVWISKPATGDVPTAIVVTALTLVAALGGVDRWKQVKDV